MKAKGTTIHTNAEENVDRMADCFVSTFPSKPSSWEPYPQKTDFSDSEKKIKKYADGVGVFQPGEEDSREIL